MALTKVEKLTREGYDRDYQTWMEKSGGIDRSGYWEEEMKLFMSLLGAGRQVIELGCGPATDGKELLQMGCQGVVSIDYSYNMLTKLAQRMVERYGLEGRLELFQMDMAHLGLADESFDAFWASASFLHLENPVPALLETRRVIKKGGLGFISVKGIRDGVEENIKNGLYFNYHTLSGFNKILAQTGFRVVGATRREDYCTWNEYWVRKED